MAFQALALQLAPPRTALVRHSVARQEAWRPPPPPPASAPVLPELYARMHFELGTTYLELGLPHDALREWELSAAHPSFRQAALRMMARVVRRAAPRELAAAPTLIDAEVDSAFDDIFDLS